MSLEIMLNEALEIIKTSVDIEVVEAGETVQNYIDAFTGQLLKDQADLATTKAALSLACEAIEGSSHFKRFGISLDHIPEAERTPVNTIKAVRDHFIKLAKEGK